MSLQFPPPVESNPHAVPKSCPLITLIAVELVPEGGLKVQAKLDSKQPQAASLGVGGRVLEARKLEFWLGHEG
jgi:hypothetical protein